MAFSFSFELKITELLPKCSLHHLKQIHGLFITTESFQNFRIASKFLRRSTEFGTMEYSDQIFSHLDHGFGEAIELYNSMIRGYAFNGNPQKSLYLYDLMLQRGIKPHNFTYPYVLNSCTDLGLFTIAEKVHCRINKTGFEFNFAVSKALLKMYIEMSKSFGPHAKVFHARKVFDNMHERPVEIWNRMISEYVGLGNVPSARDLFDEMPERDIVTWNSMISGYIKVGEMENATELFEKMPQKNIVSWTSMIRAHATAGNLDSARIFFEQMPERNVVSWNSMISSYTQHGEFEKSLNLFVKMLSQRIPPDEHTFVSVLSACSHLGDLDFGKSVHFLIDDWSRLGVIAGTALIDMYAKCGDINRAFVLFFKMSVKDIFCWNVMVKSLALHGKAEEAIKLFDFMKKTGVKPNHYTFIEALFACNHGGLIEEGRKIFSEMEKSYGVSPKIEHFGCLVDLLCRNGEIEEAIHVVNEMPFEPDMAIWGALISGCRVRNEFRFAKKCVERAIELKSDATGIHVVLSNMYASIEQWPNASIVRKKMEDQKFLKKTGHSCVISTSSSSSSSCWSILS